MFSGRALRRKKTNLAPALAAATTLYAPAVYPIPYGANGLMIGGRGTPGNAGSGGNYVSGGNTNPLLVHGTGFISFYDAYWKGFGYGTYTWGPQATPPADYEVYYGNVWTYGAGGGAPGPSGEKVGDPYPGYSIVKITPTGYSGGNVNAVVYNPYYPGNKAPNSAFAGITFPGGNAGAAGALVAPVVSQFTYQASGISVTVPPGGSVTLTPIK